MKGSLRYTKFRGRTKQENFPWKFQTKIWSFYFCTFFLIFKFHGFFFQFFSTNIFCIFFFEVFKLVIIFKTFFVFFLSTFWSIHFFKFWIFFLINFSNRQLLYSKSRLKWRMFRKKINEMPIIHFVFRWVQSTFFFQIKNYFCYQVLNSLIYFHFPIAKKIHINFDYEFL